jgi:hypothetical protein
MEIVLLWLDELDDLLFTTVSVFQSLRLRVLQIGLLAALAVALCELSVTSPAWAPPLAAVAASSVGVWLVGTLLARLRRFGATALRQPA